MNEIKIPKYSSRTNRWSFKVFHNRNEFRDYIDSLFKEPGKYNFNNTNLWNQEGRKWQVEGVYTTTQKDTKDNIRYWEMEKLKCRRGVIFDEFYLPGSYYMWINFLPIYDKEAKIIKFPTIWDAQYHMALYELRAELHYKHCPILKKRQFGSSYFHMGKIINRYWFEAGSICKIGASKENYVNDTWRFLNEYRDHLNQHTEWYRNNDPNKLRDWQQREQITDESGRQAYIGYKGIIKGVTFDKDPTAGVGGPCDIFFHEEGGIAKRANETFQFMKPAMRSGMITTGIFIIAGSVGDLEQCEPLKDFLYKPRTYDMLPVPYNLDPNSSITESGLFIPQHWSMPPFIDGYGNSDTQGAKEAVLDERKLIQATMPMQDYQTSISQAPLTIEEAFKYRKESIFPTHLAARTRDKIKLEKSRNYVCVELEQTAEGVKHKITSKAPITEFPVPKDLRDKEGAIQVFNGNFPDKDAQWGTYLAGIDPVDVGKTVSSDSLFSIYVYKTLVQKTHVNASDESEVKLEGDEIVACWTGRFDDVNDTNERAELLVEWYNAWTVVENNIKSFIQHMMKKKKTKYLASPKDLPFVKDITASGISQYEYGVRMNQTIKNYIFEGIIDYLKEVIGEKVISEVSGRLIKFYGSDKIPDEMLLTEIIQFTPELNVDRLVAFGLVLAFAKARQANNIFIKIKTFDKERKNTINPYAQGNRDIFRNIGRESVKAMLGMRKGSGFKNLK